MNKIDLITKAKEAYYNSDKPIMSDFEYDKIVMEVGYESVGAPVLDGMKKIKIIDKPMLSLDKCHTAEEIIAFSDGYDLIASIKCDGLSVRLIYENGKLFSANTRGDGYEGQDITEHVKQFLNVPLTVDTKERLVIDGEAVILQDDFNEINKNNKFKNSRNLAAGTLASLDTSLCRERRMSFIAWDLIEPKMNLYNEGLNYLEDECFFNVVTWQYTLSSNDSSTYDNINNKIIKMAKTQGIPYDGVVWKINDIAYGDSLGKTAHSFKNGIAWKPTIEEYDTRLKNIEWSLGRTGVLTPVAIFEPVEIDGTIVERASLHNYSVMQEIMGDCCYCGQHIKVAKMNMIIPQVTEAIKMNYGDVIGRGGVTCDGFSNDYGVLCPVCGGETSLVKSESGVINLVCDNPNCEGKLINKITHYCDRQKGMDIRGLSKATIEKLMDWGYIRTLSDIYNLSTFEGEWKNKPGFGAKSVSNILSAIESSKTCRLENFISAIGIPLIGSRMAKTLAKEFSTWEEFRDCVDTDDFFFDICEGIGEEINNAIKEFNYEEADKIAKLLNFKTAEQKMAQRAGVDSESGETNSPNGNINASVLAGKSFALTGKSSLGSRTKVQELIEAAGGRVTSSVSSKTNYLLANVAENTVKYNNAIKFNVQIITDEDLKNLLTN